MKVEVRAVSCWHIHANSTQAALNQVSFDCITGECVGIVGASGAGKSTLLSVLAGLIPIQKGSISYTGAPAKAPLLRHWLRKNVGIAFQQPEQQLFARTALADVMYGPLNLGYSTQEARQAAIEALQLLGLDAKIASERSPFAYSGGERRLIALAGIFAMQPKLLLLDEPTAGLDALARQRVMAAVTVLVNNGATCLLATHELALAQKMCVRLLVLKEGCLIADCHPEWLFSRANAMLSCGFRPEPLTELVDLLNAHGWQLPNRKIWTPPELAAKIAQYWQTREGTGHAH